jgi:hypothetical protein
MAERRFRRKAEMALAPLPAALDDRGARQCLLHREGCHRAQALGYFYFEDEPGRHSAAKLLTRDEARRLAVNFVKLPELLRFAAK